MGFRRLLYIFMIIMCSIFMVGCAVHASPDDYAVNEGYEVKGSSSKNTGSGYTYTHDIGIQGMQQNHADYGWYGRRISGCIFFSWNRLYEQW